MSEKSIQASEIAEYVYCRRAWWLRKSGRRSDNVHRLVAGTDYHQAHGALVREANRSRLAVYVFLAIAVATLLIAVLQVL